MNHRLNAALGVTSLLMLSPLFGGSSKDAEFSDLEVRVDDVDTKKVLDVKVGEKYTDQLLQADNPYCRAAAVLVAQEAVAQYGSEAKSIPYGKDIFLKLKDIADSIGEKRISKIAQLGASIMEGFEYDDPYAAVGSAIVKEAVNWVSDQIPKTGQKPVDDFIKDQVNEVGKKLNKALFPGENRKVPYTAHTKMGDCKVDVIAEIQLPGEKTGRGGIRLFVSGDCACKKPLRLNSRFGIPTNFRAQTEQIKNCGLGRFTLIAFLPLKELNTDVSFDGRKVDLKKAVKLIGGVKKLINGEKSDQTPDEIADDIQKQTGNLTKVKKTVLVLKPEFAKELEVEALEVAQCDNCSQTPATGAQGPAPSENVEVPRNVDAEVCDKRCLELWAAWHKALYEFLDQKKPDNPATKGLSKEIRDKRIWLNTLRERLARAEEKLAGQKPQLEKDIKEYQRRAEALRGDARKEVEKMVQRLQDGLQNLEREVTKETRNVEGASKELTQLENEAGVADTKLRELEAKADAAKGAYYECARCCWNEARSAKPDIKVPEDVLAWEKEHPIDARLVGTWRSEPVVFALAPYQSGGRGIIVTIKDDGSISMDYNGMEPFKRSTPATTTMWSGTAEGHIKTCKDEAWLVSLEKSELTHKTTVANGKTSSNPLKSIGPAGISETEKHVPYTCDETTLKYTHGAETYTFKRQDKQVPQRTTTGSGK